MKILSIENTVNLFNNRAKFTAEFELSQAESKIFDHSDALRLLSVYSPLSPAEEPQEPQEEKPSRQVLQSPGLTLGHVREADLERLLESAEHTLRMIREEKHPSQKLIRSAAALSAYAEKIEMQLHPEKEE